MRSKLVLGAIVFMVCLLEFVPIKVRSEEAAGKRPGSSAGESVSKKAGNKTVKKHSTSESKSDRKPQNNGIQVMPLDPDFSTESLQESGYNVNTPGRRSFPTQPSDVPDPQMRDQVFHEAGILAYVKDWDHLERDILFLRAQQQTLNELAVKYPGLPKKALQRLKKIMQQNGGGR